MKALDRYYYRLELYLDHRRKDLDTFDDLLEVFDSAEALIEAKDLATLRELVDEYKDLEEGRILEMAVAALRQGDDFR